MVGWRRVSHKISIYARAPPRWTKTMRVSMIARSRRASPRGRFRVGEDVLNKIFAWWNGATIGTLFTIAKRGRYVGTDEIGNKYYEARDNTSYDGRRRRWVIYEGYADASKVPPDWHGWLRYTFDLPPTEAPLPREKLALNWLVASFQNWNCEACTVGVSDPVSWPAAART